MFPTVLGLCALLCVALYFSFLHDAVERIAYLYAVAPGGLDQQPWYRCSHLEPGKETVITDAVLRDFSSPVEYKLQIVCWVEQPGASAFSRQYKYNVQLPSEGTVQAILNGTPSSYIPYQFALALFFLGSFVCASSAFVLTGLKDYLQGELGLSDADLIRRAPIASRKEKYDVAQAPGVYGIVEYSPDSPNLIPNLLGPFCAQHERELNPLVVDGASGKVTAWKHIKREANKVEETICLLQVQLTVGELERCFRESAEAVTEREYSKPKRS